MRIATSWSTNPDAGRAVENAYTALEAKLGGVPHLMMAHASSAYDASALMAQLAARTDSVPLAGATSCLGVMTEEGFHSRDGYGLGLLGIVDPEGAYGVGACSMESDVQAAATTAVTAALAQAGRPGEVPLMVWITQPPGREEILLEAIGELLGRDVPVSGGSSADNAIAGQWKQFANGRVHDDAFVAAVLFPSAPLIYCFRNGYEPSGHAGKVTRADGRTLHEIDGRRAIDVYNDWTKGRLEGSTPGNVLALTTLQPLGRVVGVAAGIPYFVLSHPDRVTPEGALTLFTNVREGDQVFLMQGTLDLLVERAGNAALSALETYSCGASELAGALVTYCAGCMLTVRDKMERVVSGVRCALAGRPFLGTFTFGEQGCFLGGENRHGNLMISVLGFRENP